VSGGVWWRLAWRNLGRNRKRTLITGAALAFGYLAAVVIVGVSDGIVVEMIDNGTSLLQGQVQVHAPGYLPERSLYATLGGDGGVALSPILDRLRALPGVTGAAPRVLGGGLVSAGSQTSGAVLMGEDPSLEPRVSRLMASIERGAPPAAGTRQVLIGSEMARKLGVSPGSEVVVVAPAADGSLGNDLFTVSGVYRTGVRELDAAYALLPIGTLQGLLALSPGRVHEVALSVADPWTATAVADSARAILAAARVPARVRAWPSFRPEIADYARLARASNWILIAIVFAMAVFGVANTMVMATFERRREFAVIRALGTTRTGVARTVVYEGLVLGAFALVAGALLTAPILVWWHRSPPDMSFLYGGFTMAGALVRPVLRVQYSLEAPLLSAAALLLTAVLAAVYPAWRATRVPPADALSDR
jgi:ABC-type lipoprotein release transport system permease subunit